MTRNREAIIRLFKVSHNRAAAFDPSPAIFPGHNAPIVRRAADGERKLVLLSWGLVLVQPGRAPRRVTNVRDDKIRTSTFWRGSFKTAGMIVAPCSVNTVSALVAGIAGNLLVRAADVHLKERRRLVLVVRESPPDLGHLRAMVSVTECGAIVAPAVPAFYLKPATVTEIADHIARRAIDLLSLDTAALAETWNGLS